MVRDVSTYRYHRRNVQRSTWVDGVRMPFKFHVPTSEELSRCSEVEAHAVAYAAKKRRTAPGAPLVAVVRNGFRP